MEQRQHPRFPCSHADDPRSARCSRAGGYGL